LTVLFRYVAGGPFCARDEKLMPEAHMSFPAFFAIPWIVAFAALSWSAATDLRNRVIPDEMVLLVAICGLTLGFGLRAMDFWISAAAAAAVFLALGFLCHHDMIGGGDVKLLSALTLLVRPDQIGVLLLDVALAGGVLSCAYLAAGQFLRALPPAVADGDKDDWISTELGRMTACKPLPYALAILGGAIWYVSTEVATCFSATSCSF
jgi:prepilin peptidase CpaA